MYYKLRCNSTQFVIYYKLRNYYKLQRNKAGDNQSLKSQRRDRESNHGPLAPQAKSLTTTLLLILHEYIEL